MPDALPLTGLFGKVPAHGDFVRRGLPTSFIGPWDAWLQAGMAAARDRLGDGWAAAWDGAPPWRFALPAGACGPDAVAGVMLPSEDMVGRRFPITLAALLPADGGGSPPDPHWFEALETAALAGRAGRCDADALAAAIPPPGATAAPAPWPAAPASGDVLDAFGSPMPEPPPVAMGNVLDLFADAPARADVAPAPEPLLAEPPMPMAEAPVTGAADMLDPPMGAADGTLAFLLDEGASTDPIGAFPVAEGDPLAALIAASDAPPPPHLSAAIDEVVPQAAPEAAPIAWAPAPAPPPGGGWWTAGGARVSPAARPWPALLPVADFASLLGDDA